MLLECLIALVIFGIWFYRWGTKNNDFFKNRNIAYEKPVFLMGSGQEVLMRKKTAFQVLCEYHQKFDGIVYGAFDSRQPVFVVREPEMVKHILIKDFDHFVNRNNFLPPNRNDLFANSLIMMENDEWRDMRNTLSPAFTGSKMRQMFDLMLQTVDEAMTYLRDEYKQEDVANGFEVDVKDLTTRLTNDIIASTAFGLQVNSFRDKENEFYMKSKDATSLSSSQQLKLFFMMLFPKVVEYFNITFLGKEFSDYAKHLVLDAMKYRQENKIHRPDMINLLMEARGMIATDVQKSHFRQWSDIDVVAQCVLFLFGGFETSSSIMSFAAHELMEYPEVQEKLFEEIQEIHQQLQGKAVTYEALNKMTYLDMVFSEVLRKWPVGLVSDRTCTKDYEYVSPTSGEKISIKKGELVRIPSCALHRDAKNFENPEVFDPERFSAENKLKIVAGTYLPFGLGPRNCIGNRFATLEVKAFLYYLVRDYSLEASPKTCLPMELDTKSMTMKPKTGFWLQLRPRNHTRD
uniref:Cytochrome P450 n=1 Tax=Stomoxys calcitrans TaxID=35570 RepID=A0A1I8PRR0_STOCA